MLQTPFWDSILTLKVKILFILEAIFWQYSSAKYGNTVKYNTIGWFHVYQQLFHNMRHNIYKILCVYITQYLNTQKKYATYYTQWFLVHLSCFSYGFLVLQLLKILQQMLIGAPALIWSAWTIFQNRTMFRLSEESSHVADFDKGFE